MTQTKADLAERLVDGVGLNTREAREMVEAFFGEISNALAAGDEVKLTGFGNFLTKEKVARPGRNPKTGDIALIAARRVAIFHASGKLKEAIRANPDLEE